MTERVQKGVLAGLIGFSLRYYQVVIALGILFTIYGFYFLRSAKYDVFPEFAPPQVSIQTEAPGLAPEQVEALVTQPIENVLNGVAGIAALNSTSIQGLSVVTARFQAHVNLYQMRQAVAERLGTLAGQLPHDVGAPILSALTSSTGNLMSVGLVSNHLSLMDLHTLAEWTIQPQLLRVPGVARVAILGGEVRTFEIAVHPQALVRYGLSLDDILATAQRLTGLRGTGFIDTPNQRILLMTGSQVNNEAAATAAALAHTAIVKTGASGVDLSLTLDKVADVHIAAAPAISAATIMGQPGIVLNLSSQYGANTLEVTREIDHALTQLSPLLKQKQVTLYPALFRAANFVNIATQNVFRALYIGAALIVVILLLFLFNLRAAAISCVVIPLSLVAATSVLQYLGYSLNTMTLGGLAIAIGLLVDDAVITVENIFRRLRENHVLTKPRAPLRVILDASLEVRSAVVYATLVVALVFLPILTLPGLAGRLFAPLALAYVVATLASLFTALTLTPALSALLLTRRQLPAHDSPIVRLIKTRYVRLITAAEGHPRMILGGIAVLALTAVATLPFLHASFLPELKEGHFIVHMTMIPGTSIEQSLALGNKVTQALLADPEVRSVAQRVGRAASDETFGPEASEFEVDLKPLTPAQATTAQAEVRARLTPFIGATFSVNTFLTERIQETISGQTAAVSVNVYANDLNVLQKAGESVAAVLRQVPGAQDVQVQSPPGTPQLRIRLRDAALARWGLDPVQVMDDVAIAYQGKIAGQIYEGNRVFDLVVTLPSKERHDLTAVGSLPLLTPAGLTVRLAEVADIAQVSGPSAVTHHSAQRVQIVTSNVNGQPITQFVANAENAIRAHAALPAGTSFEFSGTAQEQTHARNDLLLHSALTGIIIILFLSIVVRSRQNLILLLANLPFALVGGMLAVVITGGQLSIGSLVGFVTLFGISLRNAMMMIAHYEHLVHVEGATWNADTARRGAAERLSPILMTALVTALGLMPLALGANAPGREIEGPMAIVILGGLVTSTALNLLALPALALRYGRFRKSIDDVF